MYAKLRQIPFYGSLALLAYMPFHVFLSQWLSTFTGGLEVWKGAKDALTFLLLVVSVGLVALDKKKAPRTYWYVMLAGTAYGLLHMVMYLIQRDTSSQLAGLATAYNCRLIGYLIIGLSATVLTPQFFKKVSLVRFILVVSTIVCIFGLLQWLLPKDLMTHFGYSVDRGVKSAFFIDDKPDLPRVMSTLRDPNSLGAYLVIPLTIVWLSLLDRPDKQLRMLLLGLLGLHGLILFLTFSRGSWVGAFITLVVATVYVMRGVLKTWLHRLWPIAIAFVLLVAVGGYLLRDQYVVQNVIFHSDETTVAEMDSNDLHASFAKKGINGIINKPLGHGPGTAGIVSIQKPDGGLLTENYFIQIGYEVGVGGLVLFVTMLVWVEKKLSRFQQNKLQVVLFASFFGFLLMAMVSHLWTNEVVATYWWLPAGILLGTNFNKAKA